MVCKGFGNNDAGISQTCDSPNKFHGTGIFHHGMANNCCGRWGRRKQANPKRTNVDEETSLNHQLPAHTESSPCDIHPPGSPNIPSSSHGNQPQNNLSILDTPDDDGSTHDTATTDTVDASDGATGATQDTEAADALEHDKMIPDSEATPQANNKVLTQKLESPLTMVEETAAAESNGLHGNSEEAIAMETEEEKIQELLSRSDTAVIFPEPVSDQEEGTTTTTENEDVADIEDDQVRCPHCELTFSTLDQLKDHWHTTHTSSANSKNACPQCGVSFVVKAQLEKHMALHSPSSQMCKICNKTFANVYRLQRHMISHEESSELRKFKCPECGKAFKFKHHLKEHIRIHSGEKPFECQNCGKRFSHSGSYSSHMTSKKCWIVNLKMRGGAGAVVSRSPEKPDSKASRPLIPKALDNGLDMSLASMMYGSGLIPQQFLPFDPATASQMQSQFLAQLNGGTQNPFLHQLPFTNNPMTNPMMPALGNLEAFGCLPPGGIDKDIKMTGSLSETATKMVGKQEERESAVHETTDENQNNEVKKIKQEIMDEGSDTETVNPDSDQSGSSSGEPKEDMEAINKVLEIVGATVSQQQQHKEQKGTYSKLAESQKCGGAEDESRTLTALASAATQQLQQLMKENKEDEDEEGEQEDSAIDKTELDIKPTKLTTAREHASNMPCKFCKQNFTSPIHLHQHERYLCKQNHEIQRLDADATHPHLQHGGLVSPSNSTHEDLIGDENSAEADRKIRVRSMITDEQVQVLKSFYQNNQRPNKYELENLAQQIGFPKRVVQVWFQNMRARDRRKGRTFRDGSNASHSPADSQSTSAMTTTSYIPIVPQVSLSSMAANAACYPRTAIPKSNTLIPNMYGSSASPQRACEASSAAEQPLDLTVKRQEAHTNKPFSSRPDPETVSGEVLNLSVKESVENESSSFGTKNSPTPLLLKSEPCGPTAECPTFSYTQKDCLSSKEEYDMSSHGNMRLGSPPVAAFVSSSSPSIVPLSVPLQINTTPAHSRPYANVTSMHPAAFNQQPAPAHYGGAPSRLIYDTVLPHSVSPSLAPDVLSPQPSSLDSSFNSNASLDSNGLEHSGSPYGMVKKPKRARKKSWRQVEAEEFNDLDESMDEDGECVSRKKRRSWKQHRVDVAEGLYACDQCDKMFSKQSSLARHKYEHSGQRPFPCDICTKAFKHKHHLTEHKRLHSGEKPFQCQKCGKRFSHSGSYSQHMNHRYKYCKPLRGDDMGDNCDSGDIDMETEHSEASP